MASCLIEHLTNVAKSPVCTRNRTGFLKYSFKYSFAAASIAVLMICSALMVCSAQAAVTLDFPDDGPFDGEISGGGIGASVTLFDPAAGSDITITTLDIIGQDGSLASDGLNLHTTQNQNATTLGIFDVNNSGEYGNNARDFNPGEGWVVSFDVEVQLEQLDLSSQAAGAQMTVFSSAFDDIVLDDGAAGDTHALGNVIVPAGTSVTFQMTSLPTADDTSLRLNDLTFAIPPIQPFDTFSVQSGDLLAGSTWDNGAAPVGASPSPNFVHNIINGHSVTLGDAATYNGQEVKVTDGTLTFSANGVVVPILTVDEGATVTESTTGDFFLGDVMAQTLGAMELNGQLSIAAESGDVGLDVELSGTGTATVNVEEGGTLFVTSAAEFTGLLQFNGSSDELLYEGPTGGGKTVEMNSTGDNRFAANQQSFGGISSNLVFNQAGAIDHRSDGSTGNNNRLLSIGRVTANADVTIDLTKTYERSGTPNERRLFAANGWTGTGNITATGTTTDPTDEGVTLNQLEIGSSDQDSDVATHLTTSGYSGTLTLNNYLNMEVRHSIPFADVIVNQNSRIEFGHRDVESLSTIYAGEVTVNSGGILEVGNEQDGQRVPYGLQLTKQKGNSGNLTLNNGATTILQISGTDSNKFDKIAAEGNVSLDGTLQLLFNPETRSQTVICEDDACFYTPAAGDTFEIFSIVPETHVADYNGNGVVDNEDYDIWVETFGSETDLTADGNGNGFVDAADYTVWRDNLGASGSLTGAITGDFDMIDIVDPEGWLTGFTVDTVVTSTSVTLMINATAAANAVPEPSAISLVGIAMIVMVGFRRRRHLS